jgi:hypothetical protein
MSTNFNMPWVIRKLKNKSLYSVKNANTGAVRARGTTLKKAQSQVRLLYSLDKQSSRLRLNPRMGHLEKS